MKLLTLCLMTLVCAPALAQTSTCTCCTPHHGQFDFWLGDWEVFNEVGKKVGENTIIKLEDNCVLSEDWRGAGGGTGRSYNYYDPSDSTWNQLWLDNQGTILKLKGHGKENHMSLKSELMPGQNNQRVYNRITWTKNADQTVIQLWEILDPSGNVLSIAFKGIYKRK